MLNSFFKQSSSTDIQYIPGSQNLTEDGKLTYQNTVQCYPPNCHLLFLNVNHLDELLELQAERKKKEDIAAWQLMKLHNRLLTKHHETFSC